MGFRLGLIAATILLVCQWLLASDPAPVGAKPRSDGELDRSPVDVLLTRDERLAITANQSSGTVSVLDLGSGRVLQELPCGARPAALAFTPDQSQLLVSCSYSGEVVLFRFDGDRLSEESRLFVSFEPRGLAVAPDGNRAYVALTSGHKIAVLDLNQKSVAGSIATGRWPRYLAMRPDGQQLAVACSGDGGVCVLDLDQGQKFHQDDFLGLNIGMMEFDRSGRFVYFPFMVYRSNPINANMIRIGWVLASRLGRLEVGKKARREAFSLDKRGEAVADPHGLAISPNEDWLVSTASGTQELLVFRLAGLPFEKYGGTDHIIPELAGDSQRFFRVALGGRPMACRFAANGREVYIANYLLNAVQVVDLEQRKVTRTIELGGPAEPSLARKGETIFYDGKRSLDQWYSCHTCHYEGHTNSVVMDTMNDGRSGNFKTVLSLRNVTHTPPYTWHGWQKKLADTNEKSLTETMLGPQPSAEDLVALEAFMATLVPPPNPYRRPDGTLTPAAEAGRAVFHSEKAGCVRCHSGDYFTDGKLHEVGLGDRRDVYKGYNTPSLVGCYDRILYLHDGRAKSLEEALAGPHSPDKVTKKGSLTPQELKDLVEYLKSL